MRGDQLPWISPEIQQEIGRRYRLFKRYRKNTTNDLWVTYKQQRNSPERKKAEGWVLVGCVEPGQHYWVDR